MIATQMTTDQFDELIGQVWTQSAKASPRAKTLDLRRRYQLRQLFTGSETNTAIRGTRWAAYQAITEYTDHTAPVNAMVRDQAAVRAERVVSSAAVDAVKIQAFDLLKL